MAHRKLNCWEYKNCGREAGGLLADIYGVCPVSIAMKFDGMNQGQAGGRVCWMVGKQACQCNSNTSQSLDPCNSCQFYRRVVFEEDEIACPLSSTIS
jgi:hypothetical protein